MADEKKDETKGGKSEEEAPPKKSKKMLFLILGVVVLGAGGAAGFFAMKGGAEPQSAEAVPAEPKEAPAALVPLDTFLVNLSDPGGDRYMKLTLRLTISPESVADKLKEDDLMLAKVRDRILTVLTAKTFEELVSPLGKESLRREIQLQTEPLLDEAKVQDVLFSEFVVQ